MGSRCLTVGEEISNTQEKAARMTLAVIDYSWRNQYEVMLSLIQIQMVTYRNTHILSSSII